MEAFANLFRVLYSPVAAFESIKEKPCWWLPAAALIAASLLYAYISAPLATEFAQQQMMQRADQISPEQLEQAQQMLESPIAKVITIVSTLIGTIISILIQVGLLHLVASMLGGAARFTVGFAAIAYANIPIVVQQVVLTIYTATSKTLVLPGFTALLPRDQATSMLGTFLGRLDVFAIWSLALIAIGLSVTYKLTKGKSSVIAAGYWAAGTLFAIIASAVSGALGGV